MRLLPNQLAGILIGGAFLVVGVLGFSVVYPAREQSGMLFGVFALNSLHNFVNVFIGVVLVAGGVSGEPSAGVINAIVGIAFLTMGIAGFFMVNRDLNLLNLNTADHVLHVITALILLAFGLWPMVDSERTA